MFTTSDDLLRMCLAFSKQAQYTAIDPKLERGYDPRDKWERDAAKRRLEEEKAKQVDIFTAREKVPEYWRTGPYKYPELGTFEEEAQKQRREELARQKAQGIVPPKRIEEEEKELPSHATKFLLPEIEMQHFPVTPGVDPLTQLPPETKQKYLDGELEPGITRIIDKRVQEYHTHAKTTAAREKFLVQYNSFREKLKVMLASYQEANARAETQPDIEGLEESSLVEVIRGLAQYAIQLIKWKAGADFGASFYRRSILSKYLNQQFNPFTIDQHNVELYLHELTQASAEIDVILNEYQRMKKLEQHVIKHLLPEIHEFLSDPENIELLNWTDENNPDAKKQFIEEFDNSLFLPVPKTYRFERKKELSSFSIEEMRSIKTFKHAYERLIGDLTNAAVNKFGREAGRYVLEKIENRAKPIVGIYVETFDYILELDESILDSVKRSIDSSNWKLFTDYTQYIDTLYTRLKNQVRETFAIDLGSIEQYLKNVVPKRVPKFPEEVSEYQKERLLTQSPIASVFEVDKVIVNFKLDFIRNIKRYLTNSLNARKFLPDIFAHIKVDMYGGGGQIAKLVKKDLQTIISDEEIHQVVKGILRRDFMQNIPGIDADYSTIKYEYGQISNATPRNISAISEIKFLVEDTGGAGFKQAVEAFKRNYPEMPDQMLITFLKYLFRENDARFISDVINVTGRSFGRRAIHAGNSAAAFKMLLQLMVKFGKMDFNNLVKFYHLAYTIGNILSSISTNLVGTKFTKDISNDMIINRIRSLNSVEEDLNSINSVAQIIHNEGGNIPPELGTALFNNPNTLTINKVGLVKKVFKTVITIANMGGPKEIRQKHGALIKELIKSKLIKPGIYNRINKIMTVFNSGEMMNPSAPAFKEVFDIASAIETELTAISNAETFKELFVDYQPKNPNLFKLDAKINDRLRFRVLKDRDPRHLRIGVETSCCQRIGGVGETAARDSFVNPLAGVLILEWLDDNNEWQLLTQSYFHYVDKDNGYILDNVESNASNVRDSGVDLEEVYGWYATKMKEKLKLNYFLAGKGYSKLKTSKFATDNRSEDQRYFSPKALTQIHKSHYSDYDKRNSMDLAQPIFDVKKLHPTWGLKQQTVVTASSQDISKILRQNLLYAYAIAA